MAIADDIYDEYIKLVRINNPDLLMKIAGRMKIEIDDKVGMPKASRLANIIPSIMTSKFGSDWPRILKTHISKNEMLESSVAGTFLYNQMWPVNYPYTKELPMDDTTGELDLTHDQPELINHPRAGQDKWPRGSHESRPSDGDALDPRDDDAYDNLEPDEMEKLITAMVGEVVNGKDPNLVIESIFTEASGELKMSAVPGWMNKSTPSITDVWTKAYKSPPHSLVVLGTMPTGYSYTFGKPTKNALQDFIGATSADASSVAQREILDKKFAAYPQECSRELKGVRMVTVYADKGFLIIDKSDSSKFVHAYDTFLKARK